MPDNDPSIPLSAPTDSRSAGVSSDNGAVDAIAEQRPLVKTAGKFLHRGLGIVVTLAILVWMLKPVVVRWDQVKDRIADTNWPRVLLASLMFSAYLFVFRAMSWRRILIGFGHRLPVAPATRIWSISELARYLPGVIWQVVGRVYLVRPYGVSGSFCSASQVLELAIFLLANIMLAVGCLVWLAHKMVHGLTLNWFLGLAALIPVLFVLVHPKVFYRLANRVMARVGKPPIVKQLRFRELCGLLVWMLLGLLWQSMAIWLVVAQPLGLQFTKWWVVAGAYSLAWCAGFLAFWAPGGLGVREVIFVTAMDLALPPAARHTFADPKVLLGFLAFLSVLLRLWATTGELILAGIASTIDYRGALRRPDAPGVVRKDVEPAPVRTENRNVSPLFV
jgi:glycosyltransferase 2 family protein